MTRYVNPNYIKYELSKIRKSSNFNYKRAIERNKKKQLKHPPLIDLLEFMNSKNFSEAERERWLWNIGKRSLKILSLRKNLQNSSR